MKRVLSVLASMALLAVVAAVAFVYSGVYSPAADVPHTRIMYWLLETVRERGIARRASAIDVPPLGQPEQLLSGGADYNDMCAGCHLQPGVSQSDLSFGLYPSPPNLAAPPGSQGHAHAHDADARARAQRRFWVIKHGIKASGMPAWGATHDDERLWAMVAFLERLPELTPTQYQILTARGEQDPHAMEGH